MRNDLAAHLRLHIRCSPHTTRTLAHKLGVSVPTVARGIAELRRRLARRGEKLVSVKEGRLWHYELREMTDVWRDDSLLRAVGSIKGVSRPIDESVDDALYGKVKGAR